MALIKAIFAHLAYLVFQRVYGPLDSKLEQRLTNSITEVGLRQFSATVRCYRVIRVFLTEFFFQPSFVAVVEILDVDVEIACRSSILVGLI